MISSVMPSLKYSASLSALMLRNGSTAIDASAGDAPEMAAEADGADAADSGASPSQAARAKARSRAF